MARRFSVEAVFRAVDRMSAPVSRMQSRMGRFTRNLERGLRRLDRRAMNVARAFGRHLRRGLLVAGTAATGTFLALNKLAGQADALRKQAGRLNMPVEDLQEWRFVADQAGVGGESFSKSLDILSKRIGEARMGTGRLKQVLASTRPELLDNILATDNLGDATGLLMDAMNNVEDPMDRAALASAAFSNAGLNMSQIARMGSEQIRRLRLEQRENGNMTDEQTQSARDYMDALGSLQNAVKGFTQQALFPLMEPLTEAFRNMREWTIANREAVSDQLLNFFSAIINNFQSIVKWSKRIGIAIGVFVVLMGVLKTFIAVMTAVNIVMAMNPAGLMVLGIFALIAALTALGAWIYTIRDEFVKFWNHMARVAAATNPFKPIVDFLGWMIDKIFGFPIGAKMAEWGSMFADGLMRPIRAAFDWISRQVDRITGLIPDWMKNAVGGAADIAIEGVSRGGRALGVLDEDEGQRSAGGPVVVSPEERTVRRMEETRTTESSELLIRDESGRAELTGPRRRNGRIQMAETGGF